MVFDKTKAMRNAERYLAQGKIRSAITEYKSVVDNDPRDYGTMNLLGDLYTKAAEPKSAVTYYTKVAEHYGKQGFAQKAIAVYNKISKIQPNSIDVSEKLAELYKTKGSVTEAKSHYVLLAENYQAKGRTTEALAMWKQIAILDPNNTEVLPTIAELHLGQGENEEACDAYSEAGQRFVSAGRTSDAVDAFNKALGLDINSAKAINGLIDAAAASGNIDDAIGQLQKLYEENRGQTGLLAALVDAHLRAKNTEQAERSAVKLVEQDPASYKKLLDVADTYIAENDFDAAARMLSMASEHVLSHGKTQRFVTALKGILEPQPEHLEALRLYVRYCTWQREEKSLKDSLQDLARVSRREDSVEDERYALSQLVVLMPHEAQYAERLRELNALHGFEDDVPRAKGLFDEKFYKPSSNGSTSASGVADEVADFAIVGAVMESSSGEAVSFETSAESVVEANAEPAVVSAAADESPEARLQREVDSIRFYIDNGYSELAQKALKDLQAEVGDLPEIAELNFCLGNFGAADPVRAEPEVEEERPAVQPQNSGFFDLSELRSELGLEDLEPVDDSDFETKYQTAIAYQEMGLLEQAIAEFQEAAALVNPNDGTRRFFNCANLLGLCFMQNGMPKLAVKWYERALEIRDLNIDEKQALWYELGIAFEADGELARAGNLFEQVYAENVDYRDIRSRLKNMMVTS